MITICCNNYYKCVFFISENILCKLLLSFINTKKVTPMNDRMSECRNGKMFRKISRNNSSFMVSMIDNLNPASKNNNIFNL